jgi:hypothetical protein
MLENLTLLMSLMNYLPLAVSTIDDKSYFDSERSPPPHPHPSHRLLPSPNQELFFEVTPQTKL